MTEKQRPLEDHGAIAFGAGEVRVRLAWAGDLVTQVHLCPTGAGDTAASSLAEAPIFVQQAAIALARYLAAEDVSLDLPIDSTSWTTFQASVYSALRCVRFGETITYDELARRVRSGARAVGTALRRNAHHLVVPCHRVVRADGDPGCAAWPEWRDVKRRLLSLEKSRRLAT